MTKQKEEVKEEVEEAVVISEEVDEQDVGKKSMLIKLDSIDTLDQMMYYTQTLIDSKMLPFHSPEKALVAYQMGKELGLGIVTAMSNIHVISGKPSLSVHACLALAKKAGITWETLEDYEDYEMSYEKDGETKTAKTKRTTIVFHYMWNNQPMKEKISFTWAHAKKAEWATKDNWKKMPAIMLWNRTAVIGIRRVAPDALLGMYEASEVAEFTNATIDLDEQGNPIPA
jgi:hypothetical protein